MKKPCIVIDHNIPEFWQNRIFNRQYMRQFPGAESLTDVAEAAKNSGYDVMTADVYLSRDRNKSKALIWTELGSQHTDILIENGCIPAVISCGESPIIAYHFYHNLTRIAGRYEHALLFGCAASRLQGTKTRFHPLFWPNQCREVLPGSKWTERRFLTMINSNKRAFQFKLSKINPLHPRSALRNIYNYARSLYIRFFDPWMRSELYVERLKAIQHFSKHEEFDLYGQGWDKPVPGCDGNFAQSIQKSYRGAIPAGIYNKIEVLQKYRFSVCFENTVSPGYITEKIFDCFFSGCIPIYYGAPDIQNYVPSNTFVDFRKFYNYEELENYLNSVTEQEAARYRSAAAEFLSSARFDKFHVTSFVNTMLDIFCAVSIKHA